jgi:hypothetical protein
VYYIEFLRRKADVSWDEFRRVVEGACRQWSGLHPEDVPVLAIGRTWRLGPRDIPYMIVWRIPDMARIDSWTRARIDDPASEDAIRTGVLAVAEIDGGVYADIGTEQL